MYTDKRDGEVALSFDPAQVADDARLIYLGKVRTPWAAREQCPKNLRIARERGQPATIEIDEPWRPCMAGLEDYSHIVVLYWMHRARRDLLAQLPRHSLEAAGTFALRSPVRPNPVAIATVEMLNIDVGNGRLTVDAMDCLDGTPVIDIKPWFEGIDCPRGQRS